MSIKLNNQIIAGLYESQVIPQADTVNSGMIRIATQKEVDDGTDNTTAVTPFYLKQNVAENVKADGVTIVKNDDNSLTVIGQKSINNIITIDWIGTKEEYETAWNNKTITSTTVCYITDDEEEASIEGVLFIPHTERVENGIIISWTNNQGYQNPDPVLIPFVENNVPLGGTTGQILAKKSDSDYILEWIDNDYSLSKNKPQINNIELIGNKTLDELNIQIKGDYATIEELNTKANISDLSDVATSGNYNDLADKPDLFSGNYEDLTNKPELFSGNYEDLTNKPELFSGNYNDLENKPDLFSGNYNDLSNKPSIPSNTSDLVNDSGFINSIPDEYVTEDELIQIDFVNASDIVQFKNDDNLKTNDKTIVGGINELVDNSANIDLSNISQDGINRIKELSEGGGGGTAIADVDGVTIHNNSENKLEVIGEKTKSDTIKYTWIGTKEEYENGVTSGIITPETECIITDDSEDIFINVDTYTKDQVDELLKNKGLSMFDIVLKDHILTFEESQGLALQGTYVYKEAVAGSRYGYPDFYAKCLEEYENATNTETVNSVAVKVYSNGHKFYDIANKSAIDTFYNTYGIADFYGIDTENERIFLPRNNYFFQLTGDTNKVNDYVEAGLPTHTHTRGTMDITGTIYYARDNVKAINGSLITGFTVNQSDTSNQAGVSGSLSCLRSGNANFKASNNWTGETSAPNNDIYGKSDTVQPQASLKLLYYCVGNTISDTSWVDVVTQVNGGVKDLEDKTQEGINKLNNITNTGRTNCITEIPQDIKLELQDGVLTLKAGSKVYMPNGVDVFDEIIIENDQHWNYGTGEFLILVNSNGVITGSKLEHTYSGVTEPTIVAGAVWYDTTNNIIKRSQTGTDWEEKKYALPISVVTTSSGSVTAIDQTFNGFGYIGSTVFVTKGVKGLIPNGRNEDGTLNNIECSFSKVVTQTNTVQYSGNIALQTDYFDLASGDYYDEETNYNRLSDGRIFSRCVAGKFVKGANGVITSFNPKQPFRAVDYSDKTEVSGWGMPSNKYIDLTLGASESTYTAPANGWYVVSKTSTASGQYMNMLNTSNNISIETNTTASGNWTRCYLPVKKGDKIIIAYSVEGTTNYFRFIYAQGEI